MGNSVRSTAILLVLILVSGLVYIRLAPDEVDFVHVDPPFGANPGAPILADNGALFAEDFNAPPETVLAAVITVAAATPRTTIVAGDIDERMITFVTRSLVFGFPDYTTVRAVATATGTRLTILARLRYGKSDFGVNEARVREWLKALEALDQAG
jgi:uncharacterized protein (DUF1499 family)